MTMNDILTRQNFLRRILVKKGNKELSKQLRIKVINMRMELYKTKESFNKDIQNFISQSIPKNYLKLQNKQNRTVEEDKELQKESDKIRNIQKQYLLDKESEEIYSEYNFTFSEDEFDEIAYVNSSIEEDIYGKHFTSEDFLEVFYSLFVK